MKPIEISKYNESKIHIGNIDLDLALTLRDHFSFYVEGAHWNPKVKAGIWDGKIRLYDSRSSTLPYGLLPRLLGYFKKYNYEYILDSACKRADLSHIDEAYLQEIIDETGMETRDYQIPAVLNLLHKNKAIHLLPTGSGKSFCYYLLIKSLMREFHDARFLLIVPQVALVEQMAYDFNDYEPGMGEKIHKIHAEYSKETDKQIVVSTWQSLKEIRDKEFFESFNVVMVDEVHEVVSKAGDAKIITKILQDWCIRSKFRIGMTGSINPGKQSELQLEGIIGPILKSVTTEDLQKMGYLSKLKIQILLLKYDPDAVAQAHKLVYSDEMKFIQARKERLRFILKLFKKINNNSLIIFRNIKYGKKIYELLTKYFPDRPIYYVDGSTKAAERERIRLIIEDHDDAIVVASEPVFVTGINVPKLKYLIIGQTMKSRIKLIQGIGRILRTHKLKDKAVVIDLVDDLVYKRRKNYAMKHALERIKIYDSQNFKYSIKEIELWQNTANSQKKSKSSEASTSTST